MRQVSRRPEAQHVRPIVRQPAARIGEIVRIAAKWRIWKRYAARLRSRRCGAARRLEPERFRERIGTRRLPAVRTALLNREDNAVVSREVPRRIGQQETTI